MKSALSVLLLSAFAFGCGSSSNGIKGSPFCNSKYKVANTEVAGQDFFEKIDETKALPTFDAGEYRLSRVEVYVIDNVNDIRIHQRISIPEDYDPADPKKDIKHETGCISAESGNIKPDMTPFEVTQPVFSEMIVDASGKTLFGEAEVMIEIRDRGPNEAMLDVFFTDSNKSPAEKNLKNAFPSAKTEQWLVGLKDSYELQTKTTDNVNRVEIKHRWVRK